MAAVKNNGEFCKRTVIVRKFDILENLGDTSMEYKWEEKSVVLNRCLKFIQAYRR